jgi:hypothetical protein
MKREQMRNRQSRLGPQPGDFALGSLQSRAAARSIQLALDLEAQAHWAALLGNLAPLEQAFIELADGPQSKASMLFFVRNTIFAKCKLFGWPLPEPEGVRHFKRVSDEVKKIEEERAARRNPPFLDEKAIWKMAEKRLRRKERGQAEKGMMATETDSATDS